MSNLQPSDEQAFCVAKSKAYTLSSRWKLNNSVEGVPVSFHAFDVPLHFIDPRLSAVCRAVQHCCIVDMLLVATIISADISAACFLCAPSVKFHGVLAVFTCSACVVT